MATHTWTVFPASGSTNFETTARTALETWRSNSSIMDGVLYDHKARHVKGGADEIDGDIIDVDFTPSNYTPATVALIANDADHLAAHLQGIDTALSTIPAEYSHPTGDGNLHVPENSTTNEGKVLTASAVAGTYTWEAASVYSHPTGDGNLHVPANSTTNSGKVLTAGAVAGTYTWENIVGTTSIIPEERTSNTILGVADNAKAIDITSGTFTQTFTAAATLGAGWFCFVRNSGAGDITLDPNGSEEIDGLTSYIMYPGEARLIVCDGTKLTSMVLSGFYRAFAASGTFYKPPGYNQFRRRLYGAGGGGGGGRGSAAAEIRQGGTSGGGGACVEKISDASVFGDSETVTIGAGGTGGAGGNNAVGAAGVTGGNTTIGSVDIAYGGAGGPKGNTSASVRSGGGGGSISAGSEGVGGHPRYNFAISTYGPNKLGDAINEGGGSCVDYNNPSGNAVYGGASGAFVYSSPSYQFPGGSSIYGGSGGGSGGYLTAGHDETVGTAGGNAGSFVAGGGGAAGAVDGGAGGNGTSRQGGGGGGGNTDGTGGVGGAGGMAAGGGGGGAGNLVGGAGGAGGDGYAEIWGIV